jgi:Ca-activated chloride channel family protein
VTFLVPEALWGVLAVPALALIYAVIVWRRQSRRSASLALIDTGENRTVRSWRRHGPAGLFLIALAGLLFSFARPEANITLPVRTGQIILAFDTSNSMVADDVEPTRLDVAKQTALSFVDRQPGSVQIGVVAFTNGGLVVLAPTKNSGDVRAAIERLTADGGTSIGEGIFTSLTAIVDGPIELDPEIIAADISALNIGYYSNAAIIVFTDGEDIGGADPVELAGLAANAGVPVYTVGIGTVRGTVVPLDGFSIATALNESMLAEIAESTGGEYFLAQDDPELGGIFDEIDRRFERQGERIEVTSLFAVGAMIFMIVAAALSLRWLGRV